jgi:hypothetical protein
VLASCGRDVLVAFIAGGNNAKPFWVSAVDTFAGVQLGGSRDH